MALRPTRIGSRNLNGTYRYRVGLFGIIRVQVLVKYENCTTWKNATHQEFEWCKLYGKEIKKWQPQ